ncbi:MAG: hypothetical protein SGI87_05980 [Flavobacteriales bacterium]|nr:hypothetical protein [Flavobacteriales bacterium]
MNRSYFGKGKISSLRQNVLSICVLLFLSFSAYSVKAQNYLLEKKPYEQLSRKEFGPNTRNWWSSYTKLGPLIPILNDDSLGVQENFSSWLMDIGWRHKYKLSSSLSIGYDFGYAYNTFRIKQSETSNLLSPGFVNDKQVLRTHSITTSAFIRFNFGKKRGNTIGQYFDLVGEMNYHFREELLTRNKVDTNQGNLGETVKNVSIGLPFVKNFQYFGSARVGWNYISIFAKYRMSDLFRPVLGINNGREVPQLPGLFMGIEVTRNL